jgi:hypothetical protein
MITTNNYLGCPGCNGSCNQQPQQVGALPGLPDFASIGKKSAGVAVLLIFGYIAYKTFSS